MKASPDGTDEQKHSITSKERAIEEIRGKSEIDLAEPVPVIAELLGRVGGREHAFSLRIEWVDPRLEAVGIYVVDEQGNVTTFDNVVKWLPEDREWQKRTANCRAGFPVVFDEKTKMVWDGIKHGWPSVALQWDAIKAGARVGLITKSGRRTATVDLFVRDQYGP